MASTIVCVSVPVVTFAVLDGLLLRLYLAFRPVFVPPIQKYISSPTAACWPLALRMSTVAVVPFAVLAGQATPLQTANKALKNSHC